MCITNAWCPNTAQCTLNYTQFYNVFWYLLNCIKLKGTCDCDYTEIHQIPKGRPTCSRTKLL